MTGTNIYQKKLLVRVKKLLDVAELVNIEDAPSACYGGNAAGCRVREPSLDRNRNNCELHAIINTCISTILDSNEFFFVGLREERYLFVG